MSSQKFCIKRRKGEREKGRKGEREKGRKGELKD
jgi:hypothetical protein